jgi:hypothetical protein
VNGNALAAVLPGTWPRADQSNGKAKRGLCARYCHTLSAALLLGGGAIPLTVDHVTASVILRVVGACVLALSLFVFGAVLLEDR